MKYQITPASVADVPEILQLIRDLAIFEKLEHEVTATEGSLRETLFCEKPAAEVVFLTCQGQKAGFALFFQSYSTFKGCPGIYLEDLYVRPEFRGQGFGKALLKYLAKLALERNCARLEWSVLDWNKPAIALYLSLGAKPMDEWTLHRMTGPALVQLASS